MKVTLTDRFLRSLKPAPAGQRLPYWDSVVPNFGVRVTDKGAVSFMVMRRRAGEPSSKPPVRVVLGAYPALPLVEARQRARAAIAALLSGRDPRERAEDFADVQPALVRTITFADLADAYIERHASRKKTGKAIAQLIRRDLVTRWGDRPVTEVGRRDVIAMVKDIAERSTTAAEQALIYGKRVFGWGIAQDDFGLEHSPCDHVGARDLVGSRQPRERTLKDHELQALWRATGGADYPTNDFLRLLLILGCRRGELAGMTRDELNMEAATWELPGDRTKNGEPRVIALPSLAVEMLRGLPEWKGPYIFSTNEGRRPISGFAKMKAKVDRRMPGVAPWRFHDLRRTFRTALSTLQVSPLVAELAIGHKQRGISAVYDKHRYETELREALEKWCARLRLIVEPTTGGNVVPLRIAG